MSLEATSAHELKEHWLGQALTRAGIDRKQWDPTAGVDENRQTIELVYAYYGRLFLTRADLLWAGMERLVGPALYTGLMDIGSLAGAPWRVVGNVVARGSPGPSDHAAGDLAFYESAILAMQMKIFEDQATMHEAFLVGGVAEIERLYEARLIDLATRNAWHQIEGGRDARSAAETGNRTLLWRAQRSIINRFYVAMLGHRAPQGHLVTYAITLAGIPTVAGAHPYRKVFPLVLSTRIPGGVITLSTPLASGNVAEFGDRWKLIERDAFPNFVRFADEHPDEVRRLVETPLSLRPSRYPVLNRSWAMINAALTTWRVGVHARRPTHLGTAASEVIPTSQGVMEVDLTVPPSRETLGFADGARSRLWTAAGARRLSVSVRLPDGREYSEHAELLAALSLTDDDQPNQLIIQGPAAGFDATDRRLRAHTAHFGIDAADLGQWRIGASRLGGCRDRTYGTHILRGPDIGFVHIEIEISHHVRENLFAIAVLFSW